MGTLKRIQWIPCKMSALSVKSKAIEIKNISKEYRLGAIGHGTLYRDLQSWLARLRGREDPNGKLFGVSNTGSSGSKFLALNDVSIDIYSGDIVGVIGRNGAGKSTLLKLLSKITTPTSGEIRIKGRVASLLEVGTGFHSELTGRENVYLNGAILGMTKAEIDRKFDEIVAFSELEQFIDTPVKRYSSGMTVRLAFAVAAHLEAEILVVDEVLAVGDSAFRQKCIGKMKGISKENSRTVLFVSHDMGAIKSLCTRGVVLDKGNVIYDGNVDDSIHKYAHLNKQDKADRGIFSLSERNTNYPIKIKKIVLEDKDGKASDVFKSCEEVTLRFELDGTAPQGGFNIEWRLYSIRGDYLAFGGSYPMGAKTYSKDDRFASCKIHSLPLAGGDYYLNLMLRIWHQDAWDYVERAAYFSIIPTPHEETGFECETSFSGFINIHQTWF